MKNSVSKSKPEIKILAVNTLRQWAKEFYDYEKKFYSQFIGQDIFKADGSIKKKYVHEKKEAKGKLDDGTYFDVHYWFEAKYSRFDICVKACINGGSYEVRPSTAFTQYEQLSRTMFAIKDGVIVESDVNESHLEDLFDYDGIKLLADDVKEAELAYEASLNRVPYILRESFGLKRITY